MTTPEMSTFEVTTLVLGIGGFLTTWGGILVAGTRWVEGIKADIHERMVHERQEVERLIATEQKTQDHNFGEGVAAVRQHIVDVAEKVYQVEIHGRDTYAEKDDVRDIRADIKAMRGEIKDDLRSISDKIDQKR